jgi:hypothetical protein
VHRSRKPEWVNAHRGFESHPLRQKIADWQLPIAEFVAPLAQINWQLAIGNWQFRRGAGVVELAALEML